MKRRDFIVGGSLLAASLVEYKPLTASSAELQSKTSAFTKAEPIWSAESFACFPYDIPRGETVGSLISFKTQNVAPDYHSVFIKDFVLSRGVERAKLSIFAATRYELYVNGHYLGRGPSRSQIGWAEFDTYDLSEVIVDGRNFVSVRVHRDSPSSRFMLHEPFLIAEVEVIDKRGKRFIGTDKSWLSCPDFAYRPRPKSYASIVEVIDARLAIDWISPNQGDARWKESRELLLKVGLGLRPRSAPRQEEIKHALTIMGRPLEDHDGGYAVPAGSEIVLSLDEISQSYHVLEFESDSGTKIDILYFLSDDICTGKNSYITRSGRQTYTGGDSFAFKYLKIITTNGAIDLYSPIAIEVRYPFERYGCFQSSDPLLNSLWNVCARSLEILSEDAYVDCADRERSEWIDCSPPAFDCTRVMMAGPRDNGERWWSDPRLLGGLLRRFAMTQEPDGQIHARSCSDLNDIHTVMEDRSCDWVVLLRDYFDSSGDGLLVKDLWPVVRKLLDWYSARLTQNDLVQGREWEVWDNPLRYQVCEGAGLNAMVFRALTDASYLAESIGMSEDATDLRKKASRLLDAFNRSLWNKEEGAYDAGLFGQGSEIHNQLNQPFTGDIRDGRFGPTVQANLFALYTGIVPEDRLAVVQKWIIKHAEEVTSPMSYYYLFHAYYAMQDPRRDIDVLNLIRNKWRGQAESLLKTSWETLDGLSGSKIHIYGIHPAFFLSSFILGVRRIGPTVNKTLLIEPRLSDLQWAKGVCVTELGLVEVSWTRGENGVLELACDIPSDAKASLRLRAIEDNCRLSLGGVVVAQTSKGGWLECQLLPGPNLAALTSY